MMKIVRDKRYNTKAYGPVRVVCIDAGNFENEYAPILAIFPTSGRSMRYRENGTACDTMSDGYDLISEHREAREWDAYVDAQGDLRGKWDIVAPLPDWRSVRVREVL